MRTSIVAVLAVVVAGCSDGDPGMITLGHGTWGGVPSDGGTGEMDAAVVTSSDAGVTVNDGGTGPAAVDASVDGPTDAAHEASTQANAFTGAPAYASAAPNVQAQAQHNASIAGRNCADCHGGASPSSGIRFDFAGRVFADPNGTTPVAGVEVRVVDHNGVASNAHSDSSGYFWHKASTDLAIPALAGARTGTATDLMIGTLSDPTKRGACNGCHDGVTTAYLHVP